MNTVREKDNKKQCSDYDFREHLAFRNYFYIIKNGIRLSMDRKYSMLNKEEVTKIIEDLKKETK